MPELDLRRIAPVTDAEAARLASPAAFSDLATRIVTTETPVSQPDTTPGAQPSAMPAAQPGTARPGRGRPRSRRRLVLLTGFPVVLAAVAALLVTVLSPGNNSADSPDAIKALSFVQEKGTITVIIRNPYADAAWYNADLARHHIPFTLQVIPASPSLVGTILGGNYSPGVKALTGQRSCFYQSTGSSGPCEIGFTVPVNLKDEGSVWIGGPTKPGQEYGATGSIFSPGEALAGLVNQVAALPLSKVRPIFASHHLTVSYDDGHGNLLKSSSVPSSYYVTNIMPTAPGRAEVSVSPRRSWVGTEPVNRPSTGKDAPRPTTTSLPAVTQTPTSS